MKRNHYIFLGMALVALPSLAQVQPQSKDTTMNRTVVVEQEYNPIILDASKVNVLPKVEEPVVNKKEVEYAISSTPASNIPVEQCRLIPEKRYNRQVNRDMYAPDMVTMVTWTYWVIIFFTFPAGIS